MRRPFYQTKGDVWAMVRMIYLLINALPPKAKAIVLARVVNGHAWTLVSDVQAELEAAGYDIMEEPK
jgi:hypothetical protein